MRGQQENQDASSLMTRRINPDQFGRTFGKLLVLSIFSFVLSIISIVLQGLFSSRNKVNLNITDLPVITLIGSWVGIWSSLLCYSAWSLWQLRGMQKELSHQEAQNIFKKIFYLVSLTLEKVDNPTKYEKRLQLTLQSFLAGAIFLILSIHSVITEQRLGG